MSKTYLKIKIMSLAAEAKIIRREEHRWPGASDIRCGLHLHRVNNVRGEARASLLAYGFLRGRSYAAVEDAKSPDSFQRQHAMEKAAAIASRFGGVPVSKNAMLAWLTASQPLQAAA